MTAGRGMRKFRLPNTQNAYFGSTFKISIFYAFNSISSYRIIQIHGVTAMEGLQFYQLKRKENSTGGVSADGIMPDYSLQGLVRDMSSAR